METLRDAVDAVAKSTGFSGVVRVDRSGETELCAAYGLADRAYGVANTVGTRLAIASGTKGLTALAVMALVERGTLSLGTTARSLLGDDLPMIADDVTVEHLLAHRSGIGDYLDEEVLDSATSYVLPVPVHTLATAEDYLAVLDGFPTVFPAGERWAYNNSGYVVLAILAERASGTPYHDLVRTLVLEPADMPHTSFPRSDELDADAARGYLAGDGLRTNVLHLPVVGVGDGGGYSTVADLHALWQALFAGRVVAAETLAEMTRPRSKVGSGPRRYGLGVYLHATGDEVRLSGYDAGISFGSSHTPSTGTTFTVISNWTDGAGPVIRLLDERLGR